MSKSFQQLLFFIIISIPLTAQGKNRFQSFFGKAICSALYKYKPAGAKITDFSTVSPEISNLPAESSAEELNVILRKKKIRMNTAKDIALIILSSVLIGSFLRFRMIRKKQRSKLRKIIRSQHQLSLSPIADFTEDNGYGFPNISIEETFATDEEMSRPKTESLMTSETEIKLLELLEDFENGTLYNSKNMSLPFLAVELNTNTKYLSFVINRHKSADFKTYINRLRIQYIINMLSSDEKYRQYKISILADECGFSSHSKFTSIFKTITGHSPSAYIKMLDAENQTDRRTRLMDEMI